MTPTENVVPRPAVPGTRNAVPGRTRDPNTGNGNARPGNGTALTARERRERENENTRRDAITAARSHWKERENENTRRRNAAENAEDVPVKGARKLVVLADKTFGNVPLAAPLLVSAWYTSHVGVEALGLPWIVAIVLVLAIEGGVWKLSRLYEATLVEGDSTIALRLGIGAYLIATSALIYWHARATGGDPRPAAVVAAMSAAGVYIFGRNARWQRRRELRAAGKVDGQALKLSIWRWVLCPVETPMVFRHGVRFSIASPVDAVLDYRLYRAAGRPQVWPPLPDWLENTGNGNTENQDVPVPPIVVPATVGRSQPVPGTPAVENTGVPAITAAAGNENTENATGGNRVENATVPDRTPRSRSTGNGRPALRVVANYENELAKIRETFPQWRTVNVTIASIKATLGITGAGTAKKIRDALYGVDGPAGERSTNPEDEERTA
jgi:hypothetical protein